MRPENVDLILTRYLGPQLGVGKPSKRSIQVDGKTIKATIYAISEDMSPLALVLARSTDGALLVYDITDRLSYESVERWLRELRDQNPNIAVMLVGSNETCRVVDLFSICL